MSRILIGIGLGICFIGRMDRSTLMKGFHEFDRGKQKIELKIEVHISYSCNGNKEKKKWHFNSRSQSFFDTL